MVELLTPFAEKLDKKLPLNDYPRPQLKRESFINLNGVWHCSVISADSGTRYDGDILVPFSPECALSGVGITVAPRDVLRYDRTFRFHKTNGGRVLLHFGAVDYFCAVGVNGKSVGEHRGGYLPFAFDITDEIREGENEITAVVTDPTDTGTQARGKQSSRRGGIWYTPQSGIWQTVWLEEVPDNYITSVKINPDIDAGEVGIEVFFNKFAETFRVDVLDGNEVVAGGEGTGGEIVVKMGDFECWCPENPKLYDLEITTSADKIRSYFGMRKFGTGTDEKGVPRLFLNNEPYFHNGLLDQGYWSDGMYTAPTDEAMIYDIRTMKDMGFNMLRKHIKVEPLRWYYHCDRIGMLVWQDMVNGGGKYKFGTIGLRPFLGNVMDDSRYKAFSREDAAGREEYYTDSENMIDTLYNAVSLAVWVPFNEGWGQFDAKKAYGFYRERDKARTIDHASGWHDQKCGDLKSLHIYFTPIYVPKDDRPVVLSEFGGYSMKIEGHVFNEKKFFGYRKYYDKEKLQKAYEKLYRKGIIKNIEKGLSASVYTELSDVEDECNGLLTYDRRILKMDPDFLREINKDVKF